MVKVDKQKSGQLAESKAHAYLLTQGMTLLIKNYRCSFGEIDLIMQDKEDIVFVEVRSRSRDDYGHASESISLTKQNKLIKTAIHFLQKRAWIDKVASRFDVVTIHMNGNEDQLEWIKNAFWPAS